jgi:hypothetical protein
MTPLVSISRPAGGSCKVRPGAQPRLMLVGDMIFSENPCPFFGIALYLAAARTSAFKERWSNAGAMPCTMNTIREARSSSGHSSRCTGG